MQGQHDGDHKHTRTLSRQRHRICTSVARVIDWTWHEPASLVAAGPKAPNRRFPDRERAVCSTRSKPRCTAAVRHLSGAVTSPWTVAPSTLRDGHAGVSVNGSSVPLVCGRPIVNQPSLPRHTPSTVLQLRAHMHRDSEPEAAGRGAPATTPRAARRRASFPARP